MKSSCQKYTRAVLTATDYSTQTTYLYQPRCKMWNCPSCGRLNKLNWQARIGYGYEHYSRNDINNWMFVTITSNSKLKNQEQCLYVWSRAWPRLSARLRRQYSGLKYVILPEHHDDGRVHWHMIASHGISTRWLKDNAPSVGFGYMQESDEIDQAIQAIMYVSKYLGKSLEVAEWPKNLKRINTSRGWPQTPNADDFQPLELEWEYLTTYPTDGLFYLADGIENRTGFRVKILSGDNNRIVDNI